VFASSDSREYGSCVTAREIEQAFLKLPREEADALLERLKLRPRDPSISRPLTPETIAKWQGAFKLPVGNSVDHYLRIIRDGDTD
jgi:hypothetical protein